MTADGNDVMVRLAAGDTDAFDEVYRAHVDSVIRAATARCSDAHDVAEIVAETFLAVWRRAATFDADRGTPAQWIAGIAARKFLDLRRSNVRRTNLAAKAASRVDLSDIDLTEIDARLDAERGADAAARAVRSLPDRQRIVFELVAVDGLSVADAAHALGMSPAAVSMRLTRARRALRSELGPVLGDTSVPPANPIAPAVAPAPGAPTLRGDS